MNKSCPQMSVIIATPDNYQNICQTINYLRAQTIKEQLEIVIIAPSTAELALDESDLQDFQRFQVVEVGTIPSISFAYAIGVRHAHAPVVAFAENHAYPHPDWAKALIAAHQQPWAAVGPAMINANPESIISWGSFLIAYSRWMPPIASGVIDDLPGHNSSYKREILLKYGAQLETLLETESILHWDLQAQGYQIYLESSAQTQHLNPTLFSAFLEELFYYGRLFAAARCLSAQRWSGLKRLLYTISAPLIPLVRLRQIWPHIQRAKQYYQISPLILLLIILGLIAASWGEMLGYALGAGKAMEQMRYLEYHRDRYIAN